MVSHSTPEHGVLAVIYCCIIAAIMHLASCQECQFKHRHAITRCTQPLYDIGAFKADAETHTFHWNFFAEKSFKHFQKVCNLFNDFSTCVEPYSYCFEEEPTKSHYKTAIVVLDLLCKETYQDVENNFDCLTRVFSESEIINCQKDMNVGLSTVENIASQPLQEKEVCRLMKSYMTCIRLPLWRDCGYKAWNIVNEVVKRPTQVIMPRCVLLHRFWMSNAVLLTPALTTLLIASFICTLKFWL